MQQYIQTVPDYQLTYFSLHFHADECYDASNIITCEDELEKGNCGDIEVAHGCSETCATLSCNGTTNEMVHQVTNCISSFILEAGQFTENIFYPWHFKPHFKMGRIFWARNGYRYRPDIELREVLRRTLICKHAWWTFSFRKFVVAEQTFFKIEFYVASVSYTEISTYGKSTYNAKIVTSLLQLKQPFH